MKTSPDLHNEFVPVLSAGHARRVSDLLAEGRSSLAEISDTASLDAQVLLSHVLERPRTWLLAHDEAIVLPDQADRFLEGLTAVKSGIPLPYVVGSWQFYGQAFKVTPDVLIPRPETELLVETAQNWLHLHPGKRRVLEIGTGSGCIAISLARLFPDLRITATDISADALHVAQENARVLGVAGQIRFQESDLFSGLEGTFDLVCSNPPYIPTATLAGLAVYRSEPERALDGGSDGMDFIREIIQQSAAWLPIRGLLLVEIESRQGREVRSLAEGMFSKADLKILKDLAGHDRCLRLEKS